MIIDTSHQQQQEAETTIHFLVDTAIILLSILRRLKTRNYQYPRNKLAGVYHFNYSRPVPTSRLLLMRRCNLCSLWFQGNCGEFNFQAQFCPRHKTQNNYQTEWRVTQVDDQAAQFLRGHLKSGEICFWNLRYFTIAIRITATLVIMKSIEIRGSE